MSITLDGTNGITTPMYNGATASNQVTPSVNMKNRIINGAMVIDQRNAGASVTPFGASNYTLDRWGWSQTVSSKMSVQQNAGSVTPPVGFKNYLGITTVSAYSITSTDQISLYQAIEGFNIADLAWGTANAKTVTLSFQVYSSLTGTFGGSLQNASNNRSYPFTYTVPSANTWTSINITIAGDTTGTWATNNTAGIYVFFSMGAGSTLSGTANTWAGASYVAPTGATSVVGTNGATFYITGVQLEVGSSATSFDYRPYGTELALCMRYYEKSYDIGTTAGTATSNGGYFTTGTSDSSGNAYTVIRYVVPKRGTSTMTGYTYTTGASGSWGYDRSGASGTNTITFDLIATTGCRAYIGVGSGYTATTYYGQWTASAEL